MGPGLPHSGSPYASQAGWPEGKRCSLCTGPTTTGGASGVATQRVAQRRRLPGSLGSLQEPVQEPKIEYRHA